jgi:erythritol transport system ATP-binding protein
MSEYSQKPNSDGAASEDIILVAENVTQIYPGTVALDDVTFQVHKGKVNALIGENGAGKSTLMKILAGVQTPTSGKILLDQEEIKPRSPLEATKLGIGMVFQELNLCDNLSVMDNVFLAREKTRRDGLISKRKQRELTCELLGKLEQKIDPDELVVNLRIGDQQIVEIAKALAQDVRILIMDEPTSALSAAEVDVLFRVIRDLTASGVAIIYISHKLEELTEIGDYVTILRDGRKVAEEETKNVNVSWMIENMVGRNPATLFTRKERQLGDQLLKVEELTLPRSGGGYLLDHISFDLREGEVLGLFGLMGAGRSDLVECLTGARPQASGDIWLSGEKVKTSNVSGRIRSGFALVPEDRQRDGIVPTLSVQDNILLASLKKYSRRIFLSTSLEDDATQSQITDLRIRVANPHQPITALSGGNQQKVVVAKGLLTKPKVLLLDEPTRGIDVGAKSEISEIISQLAEQGFGVIFVSSELKEILAMSDRILVMSKGKITGEFSHRDATEEKLVEASAIGHGSLNGGNHHGTRE